MTIMDLAAAYFRQKVLITGGAGFIGSNLAHKLATLGADVTIVDSLDPDSGANLFNLNGIEKTVRLIQADINDERQMAQAVRGQKFMFNLAGQTSHLGSMQDPFKDLNVNSVGQLRLLEVCRQNNPEISIVFAGTRQVYGRPKYLPVDENHLLTPLDNNGVSKRAGEMYHIVYNRVHGMATCVLRMTNVYGPRMRIKDDLLTFIGWWFHQLLMGENIQIFGDGRQVRDINYVDDVIDAMLLCAAHPSANGKIYNLGGAPINLLDLARLMIQVNGKGGYTLVPFPENRKRIDIGDYYGDYSLIQKDVGWRPQVELETGISNLLAFYHMYKEHYL
ncbi:MAG TPA: SDR family NAD(P)-dependent oxidoreductase [Anaerolineales bacterium]|nr:SDR family NAD(P)-dependent oxidoreductase [Anaerolineales bacterium]HNH03743.1 SDR family NAD(P)-dependent oxidoreductase [Anaerolineales bacterium]